ncbi:hypothetical protein CDD81_5838 [Ophiocordyceps australis]|uniref:Uncharacterized protein n=1 Tax=Ophiocordyceps australis TaxID=1399860 RepID=A0A2C5X9S7_9HYPO|nr:hypothetical protein CDD81_5838 [Ophiocordyceps australis]
MAPNSNKANYKTYEAQFRMVRAIVAAHPDVKWNYKEIVACYGSDMTEHALNHRFRRLRTQAAIIRAARGTTLDMKDLAVSDDLPCTIEAIEKNNIAKYFGQSTPDGVQFQFRSIKQDADILRKTASDGGDVATCLNASGGAPSIVSTPSKTQVKTPSRRATGSGRKRVRAELKIKRYSSAEDDDDDDAAMNWSERDEDATPSKRPRASTRAVTPRRAARKASAVISDVAAQQGNEGSSPPVEPVASIFGPGKPFKTEPGALSLEEDDGYGDYNLGEI